MSTTATAGPKVFLDYDQAALDAAYDQIVYAPNREQIDKRNNANSARTRARIGEPERIAYGSRPEEHLDLYRTTARSAPLFVFLRGGAWRRTPIEQQITPNRRDTHQGRQRSAREQAKRQPLRIERVRPDIPERQDKRRENAQSQKRQDGGGQTNIAHGRLPAGSRPVSRGVPEPWLPQILKGGTPDQVHDHAQTEDYRCRVNHVFSRLVEGLWRAAPRDAACFGSQKRPCPPCRGSQVGCNSAAGF